MTAATPDQSDILGEDTLLTPDQTATALHTSPRTLERWRSNGSGPRHIRVGGRVAYRIGDIRTYIRSSLRGIGEAQ